MKHIQKLKDWVKNGDYTRLALWSPAGKGLTSWLSFVVSSVSLSLSHWYPGSGVVLDCIDSWSLHHYLLLFRNYWDNHHFVKPTEQYFKQSNIYQVQHPRDVGWIILHLSFTAMVQWLLDDWYPYHIGARHIMFWVHWAVFIIMSFR